MRGAAAMVANTVAIMSAFGSNLFAYTGSSGDTRRHISSIDHGLGGHDVLANAVAGACDMVVSGVGSYNLDSLSS
jgi:hypothetical protein